MKWKSDIKMIGLLKWIGMSILLIAVTMGVGPRAAYAQSQPTFMINNWSTDPAELERGKEFELTFTFTNVGSATASEITINIGSSADFTSLSPTQYFGGVPANWPTTVKLRVAASNSLTTGHHSLPILFTYQTDDYGHTPGSETREIGLWVKGIAPSTGSDTGRPTVVIEGVELAPSPENNGINLILTLHNTGNRVATQVVANLEKSDYFSPADGSTAFALKKDINLNKTVTITMPLVLIKSPTERVIQSIRLEYASYSGGSYTSTQDVPIDVSQATAQSARLLIEAYTTDPEVISPGATFSLDIKIANVGGGDATQVFFRLGKDSSSLGPLAPLGSSNVRYLDKIGAGKAVTVSYNLVTDGEAKAGLVPIDVSLEYKDTYGVVREETVSISLLVVTTPYFQVGLYDKVPDQIRVGDTFDLPIEIINIGRTSLNVSTVEVTSDALAISDGSLYIGPLDGGTTGSILAIARALKPGTATVTVTINYLDSFQQPQVVTETMTFEILDDDTPERDQGDASPDDSELSFGDRIVRAILGFLGLGSRSAEETSTAS
ncbi:MAG: hypothetical protein JXB07_19685 [Anaerolineae bacterium]|nr:hypothetical protein [Anaerolineae bacterium]